jgi:hypothetical protein
MQNSAAEISAATGQSSSSPDESLAGTPSRGEVRTIIPSNSVSFTSGLFQKLTNLLSSLIKDLPVVDDYNVQLLLEFLLKAKTIVEAGRISGPRIFELLYPCCRGELLICLRQASTRCDSFDQLHEKLLQNFVPVRVQSRP